MRILTTWGLVTPLLLGSIACQSSGTAPRSDAAILEHAQEERIKTLEQEIERLRADVKQAEEAFAFLDADLRAGGARADAVSSLAEARIRVERASEQARWSSQALTESRQKLAEADAQLEAGRFGSSVFFSSRARRIADGLIQAADTVARSSEVLIVSANRVNVREGPSTADPVVEVLMRWTPVFPERHDGDWMLIRTPAGEVGWIHDSFLEQADQVPAAAR